MTYEEFVAYMSYCPSKVSPLMWVSFMPQRPEQSSEWLLRWTKEQREKET
jgi:hypothetical protein